MDCIVNKNKTKITYIHVCSREISSLQTAVGQVRVRKVRLSKVRHFEVNET